ncbi:MAG TPA: hypothetical protein VFN42_14030, partial [Acetobacteraceae bacterium]|nr:hypothetical protein [Acetobacteraceae bacterium]
EWVVFAPLVVLTLWMGIYPPSFSSFWNASVGAMVQHDTAAMAVHRSVAGAPPVVAGLPVVPARITGSAPAMTLKTRSSGL